MRRIVLATTLAGLSLGIGACGADETAGGGEVETEANVAGQPQAEETIASGLEQNGRFYQAARAAGLDATLAGPGPYTVLVATDEAFARLPDGMMNDLMRPEARAELTELLTYHILPGTVLVEDIDRAIENSNGQAILATMGGETLTASREGENIVLTDASGGRAIIVRGDLTRSNGVVHYVDAVLIPAPAADADAQQSTSG